jgi:3'(2'), 5'-bisphosphate nucleotidase
VLNLEYLMNLSKLAGKAILEVYHSDFAVEEKEDLSPLTLADKRSHSIISQGLESQYPDIPILSEEGKEVPYDVRREWSRFWLVDPLDGTKEFVKRNNEFTVNIALIEGRSPVLGIIYLPVSDVIYVGDVKNGYCREFSNGGERSLAIDPFLSHDRVRVVKSRSHASPGLQALLEILPSYEAIAKGSALKFCAVAAGEADFYPRLGPTWEWDTAAGQAIVTAAGGVMVSLDGKPFNYNKSNLLNGPFMVASSIQWLKEQGILQRVASLEQNS